MNFRYITKNRNKHKEKYSLSKLKKSLVRSGADNQLIKAIIEEINALYDTESISSNKIHDAAYKILCRKDSVIAANYSLKRGLEKLGPSGYPFEILCGEILKSRGYKTKVGIKVKGQFVTHEIDVYGVKDGQSIMGECKYHNKQSQKNDVKIPLYIHSRALDINNNPDSLNHDQFYIFSNTKFSLDAQAYSEGVGMKLVSLNDNDENVIDFIKEYKLYPITCLKNLSFKEQKKILDMKIVTIAQLSKKIKCLNDLGFDEKKIEKIIREISKLRNS